MSQNFLQGQHIDAALIHKRGGGVAQLVRGKPASAQAGALQAARDDLLDPPRRQPLAGALGDEQSVPVHKVRQGSAHLFIALQRIQTGVIQINKPLLAALADNAYRVIAKITHVNRDKLG